jgi:hypothetical protein
MNRPRTPEEIEPTNHNPHMYTRSRENKVEEAVYAFQIREKNLGWPETLPHTGLKLFTSLSHVPRALYELHMWKGNIHFTVYVVMRRGFMIQCNNARYHCQVRSKLMTLRTE